MAMAMADAGPRPVRDASTQLGRPTRRDSFRYNVVGDRPFVESKIRVSALTDRKFMNRVVTYPPALPLVAERRTWDGAVAGGWWHDADEGRIVCDLCPRECHLRPGDRGFCFVRENRDGQMVLTTYGRSTGFCVDPIEKKPLNHFYPGTSVLSFGTAGCNLGCKFCQNWSISKSREVERLSESAGPETIAHAARELGCRSVAFTYNDPVIWAEYAIDTARVCRAQGIKTVAVTAGYVTPAARGPFFEFMDAANVDLKAFTEEFYQQLTLSHLEPVLDTLRWLKQESDVWLEITNLVIPRANDGDDEFRRMVAWILENLGDEVPLHFTAFHPDFRLRDREATPIETLLRAEAIAREAGVKYAYVGNVDDATHQSTYCPACRTRVIERNWYELGEYRLEGNHCAACGQAIAGHFDRAPGTWGRRRLPVRISQYQLEAPSPAPDLGSTSPAHDGVNPMSVQPTSLDPRSQADVPRPELTPAQEKATLLAASAIVRAAVERQPVQLPDPTLAGAADVPVFGCFVSIKRKGQLRGCCGFLGRRDTLLSAITDSAAASATADIRLPRVVADELPFLDLEIWLLYGQEAIPAHGRERISAVEIGRHGLQVQRGESRGLLLPGVATDHGMDAEGFLQQVCLKAGLPPTAWSDDETQLATFEGLAIQRAVRS